MSKVHTHMSHHQGTTRIVIDIHRLVTVTDTHHPMIVIDIHRLVIVTDTHHLMITIDDTPQDKMMTQEDDIHDMKATNTLIRCLPLLPPPPQWHLQEDQAPTRSILDLPSSSHAPRAIKKDIFLPLAPSANARSATPKDMIRGSAQIAHATNATTKATSHGNVPISYVSCAMLKITWLVTAQHHSPRSSTSTC